MAPYVRCVGHDDSIPDYATLIARHPPTIDYLDWAGFVSPAAGPTEIYICRRTGVGVYEWQALAFLEDISSLPVMDWLLFNGAVGDSLNAGRITTTRMPKTATNPGIQFKVDLEHYDPADNIIILIAMAHSTLTQTLDLDLNYVLVNPGENFNTKAPGVVLNETPVTPGVAYEAFTQIFTIPAAAITAPGGYLECQLSRDNAGADTGDLHIWEVRAYQAP